MRQKHFYSIDPWYQYYKPYFAFNVNGKKIRAKVWKVI